MLKIYLAGSIRDNRKEDIEWRETVIDRLGAFASFLNPLAGKTYNSKSGKWHMNGIESKAGTIVQQDFWCVDHADIVIFNFSALTEKYPNIGTLVEFGRSTGRSILRYSIIDPNYTGHGNTEMYGLHPFLEVNSAAVFNSVETCCGFLEKHLKMLSGQDPHFGGIINE